MATNDAITSVPTDIEADVLALTEHLMAGKPLAPDVARRIEERAKQTREVLLRTRGVQDISVQLIREARGALDDDQECELTLAQRELLRQGRLRIKDPETGATY